MIRTKDDYERATVSDINSESERFHARWQGNYANVSPEPYLIKITDAVDGNGEGQLGLFFTAFGAQLRVRFWGDVERGSKITGSISYTARFIDDDYQVRYNNYLHRTNNADFDLRSEIDPVVTFEDDGRVDFSYELGEGDLDWELARLLYTMAEAVMKKVRPGLRKWQKNNREVTKEKSTFESFVQFFNPSYKLRDNFHIPPAPKYASDLRKTLRALQERVARLEKR